jgi:hypothetical protein
LSFGIHQNLGFAGASHEFSQIHGQFEVLNHKNASNSLNFSLSLSPKIRLALNPPIRPVVEVVGQFTIVVHVCGSLGVAWALPLAFLSQGVRTWTCYLTYKARIRLLGRIMHLILTMCILVMKKLQVQYNLEATGVIL